MNLSLSLRLGSFVISIGLLCLSNDTLAVDRPLCDRKITLEEFRAYSFKQSPLIADIDGSYANQLAAAFNTEALNNPELQIERTFTGMKLGGSNEPMLKLNVGQPIRLSDFGSRAAVAELMRRSGDQQQQIELLEFTQRLTVQFKTLFALEQTKEILARAETRAIDKVSLIQEGVRKGLFSKGDEKLFEGERYLLEARQQGIEAKIAFLQGELSRATGISCALHPIDIVKQGIVPSDSELIQKASSNRLSERSRIELLERLAAEQLRSARLDAFPTATPRLLYEHTEDGGDFYGAGVSLSLPLWNRNQGERIKSEAELNSARVRRSYLADGGLEAQIANLRRAVVSSDSQVEIFSNRVIPSFETALQAQEKLYAQGKGSVLQVWQTLRAFNEVQTQGLELWLEAASARIQLSTLIGEEI